MIQVNLCAYSTGDLLSVTITQVDHKDENNYYILASLDLSAAFAFWVQNSTISPHPMTNTEPKNVLSLK